MTKRRLLLLAVLAAVLSVTCIMFTACNKTAKHTVTWTVDSQVTVKVAGYDELPTELAEETVVNFTLEFANGYELGTISGAKADGNGYTFTVGTRDVEIKITAIKSIASLEVTNPVNSYYAGETVDLSEVSVKVNYVVGDPETVTGDKCAVAYQNGDAFSLGDTKYTVKYGRGSADVTLDSAVLGLITLNLSNGTLSADELAKLPEGATEDKGVVTWTFAEALEEDIVLPEPVLELPGRNLLLERWSGVENNKIAKGTNTSVTAVAVYEPKLVEIKNMEFTSKEGVPYLVIKGEFIAADSVYLYIYNGKSHIEYEKKPSATKQENSNEFTIELNLDEYAKSTPVYNNPDEEEDMEKPGDSFKGPWMDIRFCVKIGENEVQQELFVSDDATYANLYDNVVAKVGENWYRFSYKTWSPGAGDKITGGNGAVFTGEENILKLYYEDCPDVVVTLAELEVKEDVAYLVLNGRYIDKTGEATKADVEKIIKDLTETDKGANDCSIEGYNYWDRATTTRTYIVNEDLSWSISFALDGTLNNHCYWVHFQGDHLLAKTTPATVTAGNFEYTLCNNDGTTDWLLGCVWVEVADTRFPKLTANPVSLEKDGDTVYYVITGTYKYVESAEALKTYLAEEKIDWENGSGWTKTYATADMLTVTIDSETNTFVIKADITDLGDGYYYGHLDGADIGNNNGIDAITVGNKSYSYKEHNFGAWTGIVLVIEDVEADAE